MQYPLGPDVAVLQDLLYAELDAFEPIAIDERETADGWRVFFRLGSQRDRAIEHLTAALADRLTTITPLEVPDEDWARRSQQNLKSVRVGRIVVAPPWDVPGESGSGEPRSDVIVVIEPSTGFGTGHHPTTRLCLELLQEIELRGRRVIDVGTGSGVLAIAAAKLGAAAVTAFDNDPDAIRNARENIHRNGTIAVDVREADLSRLPKACADVVLANLTAAVLQRHAAALRGIVAKGGSLIVSGFSPEELGDVTLALGWPATRDVSEENWAAARLRE